MSVSFETRYNLAVKATLEFCDSIADDKPLLITGRSGSGKSHLVKLARKELSNRRIVHIQPPQNTSYAEKIASVVEKEYKDSNRPGAETGDFLSKTFFIDEFHKLIQNGDFDMEFIQEGVDYAVFGDIPVLFSQLVFLTHDYSVLGTESENSRTQRIDIPSPPREFIIDSLIGTEEGFTKPLLKVAAEYSARNFREVQDTARFLIQGRTKLRYRYGLDEAQWQILQRINGVRQISKIAAECNLTKQQYQAAEEALWIDKLITLVDGNKSIRVLTEEGLKIKKSAPRRTENGLTVKERAAETRWLNKQAK